MIRAAEEARDPLVVQPAPYADGAQAHVAGTEGRVAGTEGRVAGIQADADGPEGREQGRAGPEGKGRLPAADARLLAVLADKDHVEGRAEEHLHGTQGVTDAVRVTALDRGGAARADRRSGGVDGGCAHVSMVARGPPYRHRPRGPIRRPAAYACGTSRPSQAGRGHP